MTCEGELLRILQSLQKRDGWAHVSERVLREMFEQDTAHAPGQTTITKALDRLGERGWLYQIWVQKGGPVDVGYRDIRVAQSRQERAQFLERRRRHGGRREIATRVQRNAEAIVARLLAGAATPKPAAAPEAHPRLIEARKDAARAELAELAVRWGEPPSG